MNRTKIEWTDYTKGWIEALIDGEGSLSLLKERRPHFKAGVTFKPRLNIGNKDARLLIRAKEIIGAGCIAGPNKNGVYNFDLSANGIRWLLPKIQLISKEEQRQLLIEALQILNRHAGRSRPRTDEELQRLEEIYHLIRKKNGRKWNKK
jgi:hypothetical protein